MPVAQTLMSGCQQLARAGLDLLLPPLCLACKEPVATAGALCTACFTSLRPLPRPCCDSCGLPLPAEHAADTICLGCMADPPPYDSLRSAWAYDGSARQLLLRFKNGRETLAPFLARAMLRALDAPPHPATLVIPVPLHRWRLVARGYNQSLLLARAIARPHQLAVAHDCLVRTRPTPRSRGMSRARRQANAAGAFAVPPQALPRVKGASILLVDDVLTSGATAAACTRILKRAGAAQVDVVTVARVAVTGLGT